MDEEFEFVVLGPKSLGFNNFINCVSLYDVKRRYENEPYVRVSNNLNKFDNNDFFIIEIKTLLVYGLVKSKELKSILEWVELNRDRLISFWYIGHESCTADFLESLEKIENI